MKKHHAHFEKSSLVSVAFLLVSLIVFPAARGHKSGAASKATAAEGQKLFKENCNMCHFPDKTDHKFGPGLKGLFRNKELPESHKPATEANVRDQIEKGSPNAKPMPMPAFTEKLRPEQFESLMAYLKTL